jgi:hypothetical protein
MAAAEWFNIEGRLSSRIGGAGGSKWDGAGLLSKPKTEQNKTKNEKKRSSSIRQI